MAIDRAEWTPPFRKLPNWLCPRCRRGHFMIAKGNDLRVVETGPSKKTHSHEAWDPEWVTERFAGILTCNNSDCGEVASISGTSGASYYVEEDIEGKIEQVVDNELIPLHIFPSPHIFEISKKCPTPVRDHIISGFDLIWSDVESCANKFRIAVEALLTDRKIPTYAKAAAGSARKPLNLHQRIQMYKAKNAEVGECLEAIKWMGNHGSHHISNLNRDNVLTAAEIMEYSINAIYEPISSPLRKVKKINKKKGPI